MDKKTFLKTSIASAVFILASSANAQIDLNAFAPTSADPSMTKANAVEVYGNVNIGYVNTNSAGVVSQTIKDMNTGSKVGFFGQRDFNQAGFDSGYAQLELQYDAASGSANAGISTREGWVGLKGGYGDFAFGRGKSGYTKALEFAGAGFDGSTVFDFSNGNTAYTTSSGVNANRWANDVRYIYNIGKTAIRADYGINTNTNAGLGGTKFDLSIKHPYSTTGVVSAAVMAMKDVSNYSTTLSTNYNACVTASPTSLTCTSTQIITEPSPLAGANTPGNNNTGYVIGGKEVFHDVIFTIALQHFTRTTGTNGATSTVQNEWIGGAAYMLTPKQRINFGFERYLNPVVNGIANASTGASTITGLAYNYALDAKTNLRAEYTKQVRDSGATGSNKFVSGIFYTF